MTAPHYRIKADLVGLVGGESGAQLTESVDRSLDDHRGEGKGGEQGEYVIWEGGGDAYNHM